MKNYKEFTKVFNDRIINQYKEDMLARENDQTDDYKYVDIVLDKVNSCADKKQQMSHFWLSIVIMLESVEEDTGITVEPTPTRYYLQTGVDRVSLTHDYLDESFTEVWDTPEFVEKELIEALLKDMINLNEYCFTGLTSTTFNRLFKDGFINQTQFSDEAKMKYYKIFGEENMLSEEAKDIFLF